MLHSFLVQPLNRRFSRIHWLFSEWHDDDVVIMKHFIQPVLLPHAGDGATTINRRSPTLTFHKCHNIPIHSCNFATIQRYTLNAFSVVTYNRIIYNSILIPFVVCWIAKAVIELLFINVYHRLIHFHTMNDYKKLSGAPFMETFTQFSNNQFFDALLNWGVKNPLRMW